MAIIAAIAFWIAAVVSIWRLAVEGSSPAILIPAICLPIGAILMTKVVVDLSRKRNDK